jgi:hypothetical protein
MMEHPETCGFPAGFRRVSGGFPAGFRRVSGGFPAGFWWVSGGFPAGFRRLFGFLIYKFLFSKIFY